MYVRTASVETLGSEPVSVMEDQRDSVSPTLAVAKPEGALEAEHETASASLVACHAAEDGVAEHDAQLAEACGTTKEYACGTMNVGAKVWIQDKDDAWVQAMVATRSGGGAEALKLTMTLENVTPPETRELILKLGESESESDKIKLRNIFDSEEGAD